MPTTTNWSIIGFWLSARQLSRDLRGMGWSGTTWARSRFSLAWFPKMLALGNLAHFANSDRAATLRREVLRLVRRLLDGQEKPPNRHPRQPARPSLLLGGDWHWATLRYRGRFAPRSSRAARNLPSPIACGPIGGSFWRGARPWTRWFWTWRRSRHARRHLRTGHTAGRRLAGGEMAWLSRRRWGTLGAVLAATTLRPITQWKLCVQNKRKIRERVATTLFRPC